LKGKISLPTLISFSETLSVLHELRWRNDIPGEMAKLALRRRAKMPVRIGQPSTLSEEAWKIADDFGWAKTYDAETWRLPN
jgi:hypothetical protein